ncbi:NXPE family member 3-like isoform X1 [Conger conger]|uniref:NXPE family member 3-like isoform X1 n=2 Tax=Conger conger TaxID=82655 RepID=UPI002A5AA256|nr:NXPE family member 3-like isoform X1 [Conger conger]
MGFHRLAEYMKSLFMVLMAIMTFLGIIWMKKDIQSKRFFPVPASHHNDTKSDDLHIPLTPLTTLTTKPVADIGMAPHEVHQILELLHWPGPDKQIEDFLQSTTPSNTYFYIPGLGKSYKVGEELRVTVLARDFHEKPKQYGGDYFQAKLFSSKLKASVFGEVTDLENGSYSVRFLLPWSGEARVAVRLIHSSEAVQVLKQLRKYQSDRVYFKGLFVGTGLNGKKLKETMECNSKWDGAGLERMQKSNCCEYPDPKTGEVWLCKRPKYLPCDALVYHVMGGYRAKLGTLQKKLVDKKYTNQWIKGKNNTIIINPSNTTVGATERCRPGLQIPVPAGFYMRDVWTSLVCTTGHFNAPKITQCLKDRELFMMGDSTMRQWYHYLGSSVPSMKYINLHSAEQAGPLLAVDVENNIVLHWRAHGTPLRSKAAPFVDLHYISNEIDSIAGGSRKVIIFDIWAHFTTHPLEYYIRRVARIRQAVIALLKRAPDTIVAIKSANTGSKNVYGSDWLSIQLDIILRSAFQGINVAFIDVWQMTSCHYSKESIHPNPTVIGNEINLLLSFICPV